MLPERYQTFYQKIIGTIAVDNIITDPLKTITYGTDASFYRLIPKIVVNVQDEKEVQLILREASKLRLPVTFRAAGTSLSGQAISDSILVRLGAGWRKFRVFESATKIQLEPGIIGSQANAILAEFDKKIGPDPASIDSAKIGGILANNASGMCCGVEQNSYQTIDSMRVVLVDGTAVDTAEDKSRAEFERVHRDILEGLAALRAKVLADEQLSDRIRYKFKIKNTTGYSLNAFVDFEDPYDIMTHLMIGSEGTLGFISDVVYRTVVEHRHKSSALIIYPDVKTACEAIPILQKQPVAAAELMDRAGLRSVQDKEGMPTYLKELSETATALLVETRAESADLLKEQIDEIVAAINGLTTVFPIEFTDIPAEYGKLWKIRKGLFPAVGAVRKTGTTVIIEDVAFPGEHLADAALDLQELFKKYAYDEALIFGHALDGNLHFVFTQDFSIQSEVVRYRDFMADVVRLVVEKYDGSLKAEHGTGRNMAPFVEKEWGEAAFNLMREVKALFDPLNLLNPGVILNEDAEAHVKNLKPLPATHGLVDKCIECGFCEPVCPSKDITFTPRQRIVGRREISRQMASGADPKMLKTLIKAYQYPGKDTCAADSLCSTRCPVGIDTGKMVKALREESNGKLGNMVAELVAGGFSPLAKTISTTLSVVDSVHKMTGTSFMEGASGIARKATLDKLPLWNKEMPAGVPKIVPPAVNRENPRKVVYFPSCASRAMSGPAREESERDALPQKTMSLLKKAGYEIIFPENLDKYCCGQAFESKGFMKQADAKSKELSDALLAVSDNGAIPVLCDTSPCLYRMKANSDERLELLEPIEFVLTHLMDKLEFTQQDVKVAVHPTCSTRKMGLEEKLEKLARACAKVVVMPEDIYCCGFAGDRGFNYPELNESALKDLKDHVCTCDAGYSTSKTCEIGLSLHGGIPYRSILYLVDDASKAKV
ncbi:FAD-binding and (Fe-S)-binding domain-containing protein [Desulforhopalus sp. IMCC35007]|uniref:FAD-binding and (Fe-S)-binding domain-containing protein n=1 Tax=Desulforhopalus sp. IMCC35007 TaxID=2569543 RepID=UPI0010AEAC2B|nr:FAD-binding and (Fe-S)-binding domain-containing protein [Desulforhopalus sp. IMCC35007]TKB08124.1 FAD-binding oxidoreductase [Desulforhopalus sp. IMCC35007]